jgi:hypothetical protein
MEDTKYNITFVDEYESSSDDENNSELEQQICQFKDDFEIYYEDFRKLKQMFLDIEKIEKFEEKTKYYDEIYHYANNLTKRISKFIGYNINLDSKNNNNSTSIKKMPYKKLIEGTNREEVDGAVLRRFSELRKMYNESKSLANDAIIKQTELEEELEETQSFEGLMKMLAQNNSLTGNGTLSHERGLLRQQAMIKSLQLSNGKVLNCNPDEVLKADWRP